MLGVLIDCGVPIDVAHKALDLLGQGKPMVEAVELCLAAIPELDPASLALADLVVARAERAVRGRVLVERALAAAEGAVYQHTVQ